MCVNGLNPLITFNCVNNINSCETTKNNALALYVGDVGVPYFYVRHRCNLANVRDKHVSERMYVTHQGTNSLFEALAIIIAIIHQYYNDNYTSTQNELDLTSTGMIRVINTMK